MIGSRRSCAATFAYSRSSSSITGIYPDMTEHGWERDDWPAIFERVIAADILVLITPIWLGEKSSVCTQVIERLYGNSSVLNENGQDAYYGRACGCLVTATPRS
jgi:multimeric flavodoxin WrbA